MKIAVLCEVSSADKNPLIIDALDGRGHELINFGMKTPDESPSLSYIHTSFMTAAILNLNIADFVVSGCGTGQGFCIASNMYSGVFCGHIVTPIDAWLFAHINAGNVISLALNQGFGWASEIQLKFIFDRLFEVPMGKGYPEHRKSAQQASRVMLSDISKAVKLSFPDVVRKIDPDIIKICMSNQTFSKMVANCDSKCVSKQLILGSK